VQLWWSLHAIDDGLSRDEERPSRLRIRPCIAAILLMSWTWHWNECLRLCMPDHQDLDGRPGRKANAEAMIPLETAYAPSDQCSSFEA